MRASGAIAAFLAVLCAACTSSGAGTPPPTMSAPHTTVDPASTLPTTPTSAPTSSPSDPPARPTVPADVPRTGPNTRKGEKPPVMPAAATKHTTAGAQAFAEFFIKTIDWGYATTSSAYMRHYFARRCKSCVNVADGFDQALAKHEHFVGGRITTMRSSVRSRASHAIVVVVPFEISAFVLMTASGKPDREDSAHGVERFDVTCGLSSRGWQALEVDVER